ncbi:MAG: CPBP family intramembrane metalloprotease [bacterium]|nr:CPBP family intramembrane metalloprotease [bacterium]
MKGPAALLVKLIDQNPLISFFVLTYVFTWSLLPLAATSIPASLVALCGPAFAAMVVAACEKQRERREFYARVTDWRIPPGWYLLALLLPLPITVFRSYLEQLLGAQGEMVIQPISVLGLIVFVLVAGEEIGWRGFALPRLIPRFGNFGASVILGVIWAFRHLPLFYMPSMPQFGGPFLPYIAYTVSLSLILTFLSLGSRGSVVIATLFHGAVNTIGLTNGAASHEMRGYSNALSYGLAAVLIFAVIWYRQKRNQSMPLQS